MNLTTDHWRTGGGELRMTDHALNRAIRRHITPAAVAAVLTRPTYAWPAWSRTTHPEYLSTPPYPNNGRAVTAYQRGPLRVIVGDDDRSIVSVMWDLEMLDAHPDRDTANDYIIQILEAAPMTDWTIPAHIDDVDLAFPARGVELTPVDDVPDDFTEGAWGDLVGFVFATGGDDTIQLVPRDGVEGEAAWRHLRVVLGCYGTKHQDKVRGAAWLLSLWFRGGIWTSMSGHPMSAGDPDVIEALRS